MLLAGCAEQGDSTAQSAAPGSDGPVVVATPGAAEKMKEAEGPFPAVPAGYRGLGGAFSSEGTNMIITADNSAALQKYDEHVGIMHGLAVGGYSEEQTSVARADCQGTGDTPQSAIVVQGLKQPAVEEVAAGIACARLLHPGTHLRMSQAIAGERGYLSQVVLSDGSGTPVVVYVDMNRMANQLIKELGG